MIVVFSFLLLYTATFGMTPVIPLGLDGGPGAIVLMVALIFLAILLIFIFRPGLRPYEKSSIGRLIFAVTRKEKKPPIS